ncbi:hypothetical protein ACVIGA_002703 [Bradyrhizobium sp. USDA 3240]
MTRQASVVGQFECGRVPHWNVGGLRRIFDGMGLRFSFKSGRLAVAYYVVTIPMMILFIYGASRFGDGPIRECANGGCLPHDCHSAYCSTRGHSHTADQYRAYKDWETTIFIVWPIGMAALALLRWIEKRSQ